MSAKSKTEMPRSLSRTNRLCLAICFLLPAPFSSVQAAAIWTNSASGLWHGPVNWAAGNLPSFSSGTYVTNAGSKSVTLNAATPQNNLTIGSLNIWAPASGSNHVLLSDLGAGRTLLVSNVTMDVRMRGALQITNSALVVTSVFAAGGVAMNIWAGSVTLDSGSIVVRENSASGNLSIVTRVGRTNVASLNINGGSMYSSSMQVGQSGLANSRSHGTVRMAGGLLTVPGELSIGTSVNCTGVVEMVGGQIYVPNNFTNITRVGDQGVGLLMVSNALVSVGNISVGRHNNSDGTVVLLQDGTVHAEDDFSIGRFGNATGRVFVADGYFNVTNNSIWVGREGIGSLIVSNGLVSALEIRVAAAFTNTAHGSVLLAGGTTTASLDLTLGNAAFSTGRVDMVGGSLLVSNAEQNAVLYIPGGTFTLEGGNVAVDSLVLTNESGAMIFNGGSFLTGGSVVSNGLPFVIGDGTNVAVMELRGGTHVFANGLVISPNATLTGCGVIVGEIFNNGINALNCDGPGLRPFIIRQPINVTTIAGNPAAFSLIATSGTAMTYQWLHNGNILPGEEAGDLLLLAVQAGDVGGYAVVVSNDSGSTTSRVASLTLVTSPVITVQPLPQVVMQNSPFTLEATAVGTAPLSYQWLLNSNAIPAANASSFSLPSAQLADSGDYQVVVSNPFGSATSVVAPVLVLAPPVLTAQPASQNPASNSPVTFSVTATGSPALLYQWRRNGTNLAGATDASLSFASAELTHAGLYSVVVRNPVGVVTSQVASLTFQGPAIILVQPASQTNARNTTVNFSVVASGTSPLSYRWRFNTTTIANATNSTYSITNLGTGNAGNYTVVVTNSSGAVTSQVAVLTVLTVVSISTQPTSQTATQGVTASLRVVGSGSNPLSYQWRYVTPGQGETNINGATSATLTFNNPQTNQSGSYRVVVSNPVSAVTSQVATLTVLMPPGITQQPQSLTVRPGSNVSFSVTASGSALSYRWRKNSNSIPGATTSSYTITNAQAADAGSYSVVVSNAVGSVSSTGAVLTVLVITRPQLIEVLHTNNTTHVRFVSASGLNYTLEYKDHLEDAAWTSLPTTPGTGGLLTLVDPVATVNTRFYRVRVE